MFILYMNDMRSSKFEQLQPVLQAPTKEEIVTFLEEQTVEVYTEPRGDGFWGKSFKKGGPLEWYNKPYNPDNQISELTLPTVSYLRSL